MTAWDLKPRTIGELLDAAFFLYRRQFLRLLTISLLVSLPALVVATLFADQAAAAARVVTDWMSDAFRHPSQDLRKVLESEMQMLGKVQWVTLLQAVLQSISRGSAIAAMAVVGSAALHRERSPSVGAVLRRIAPRLPAAIFAQAILDYFIGIGMVCCLVPGILLAVVGAPTVVAITLEVGKLERLLRAHVPAWIRWLLLPPTIALDGFIRAAGLSLHGPTIGRGTGYLFFLLAFISIANAVAVGVATLFISKMSGWFWAQHYSEMLVLPVWGLGVTFWYADLRVRREGLDLAVAE